MGEALVYFEPANLVVPCWPLGRAGQGRQYKYRTHNFIKLQLFHIQVADL